MTLAQVEEARTRWIAERPSFVSFAKRVEDDLKEIVRAHGIVADVSCRAKEVHSLVKKLLAKTKHTYESLPDKVGVRIVVRYRADLTVLLKAIENQFAFKVPQDKSSKLGSDRVGYLSIHVDKLRYRGADAKEFPPRRFFAELQLRTLAQHLWAEVSHDAFYKNDELIQALPKDLRRRVNLMAGLVEVADREIDSMNSQIPNIPGAHLLKGLESFYYRLTAEKPNVELSLKVIELLLPLYKGESEEEIMRRHVSPTFIAHEAALRHVYSNPEGDYSEASAFLFQPEALLLYDRLQNDPDGTLAAWNSKFPTRELERVAVAFGLSLD